MNQLPFVEQVRRRPGMYVGPTDVHAIYELIDSVCIALLTTPSDQPCTSLQVMVHPDHTIEVHALGCSTAFACVRDPHTLTHILTTTEPPRWDAAAHLAIANALASSFQIDLATPSTQFAQTFAAGQIVTSSHQPGSAPRVGVRLRFVPDATIITGWNMYTSTIVINRLRHFAIINGIPITYSDHSTTTPVQWHYPNGIRSFLEEQLAHQGRMAGMYLYCTQQSSTIAAEVALHWGTQAGRGEWSFVNQHETSDGGSHVRGMWQGLTEGVDRYVRTQGWLTADQPHLRMAQLPNTMTAVLVIQAPSVQYAGATKERVHDPQIRSFVRQMVRTQVGAQFAQHPQFVRTWLEQLSMALTTRQKG